MATFIEIAQILEAAAEQEPLSLAEIGRRMNAKRVRHETITACVRLLESMGYVLHLKTGVLWTFNPNPELYKAIRLA